MNVRAACLPIAWFSLTDSWDVPPLSLHAGLWLRPRILGVITRTGTWRLSIRIMTFMTGVRTISSILMTSWRSVRSEDQWKQMRELETALEMDVQGDICLVSAVTPQHSGSISERLPASKYSRCITDLLFTLYRNPASQPHKHHNSEKRFHSYHPTIAAKCKYFCIIECIFRWISLLSSRNWNINSKKF